MITRDDWLTALTEAGYNDQEHDEDALTVEEFAKMVGVPKTTAESRLRALVLSGRAVRTRKRGVTSYGRHLSFVAYRLVQPDKKARKRKTA